MSYFRENEAVFQDSCIFFFFFFLHTENTKNMDDEFAKKTICSLNELSLITLDIERTIDTDSREIQVVAAANWLLHTS